MACLMVSSIHPALQMLQLPMNIRGKGLEILTPALPAPPHQLCVYQLCVYPLFTYCRACGQIFQTFSLCITFSYTTVMMRKTCENMWTYFTRVVAVDNKVHFSKNSSKQAASLSSNMRTTSRHSYRIHGLISATG